MAMAQSRSWSPGAAAAAAWGVGVEPSRMEWEQRRQQLGG